MSNVTILEQAKKEAKRLLRLARNQNTETPQLDIKNLHDAKEIVAKLQGYPSWAAFERTKDSSTKTRSHELGTLLISESSKQSMKPTFIDALNNANVGPLHLNIDDNFNDISSSNFLKYRFKNETKIPFVKKQSLPWTLGTKKTVEHSIFNLKKRNKSEAFNLDFSDLRSHIQMAGSNYNDRHTFLMTMAQTQMRKGDPLIYFDSAYSEDTVEELRGMSYYLNRQDSSSVRVLRMDNSATSTSSIDPFEELSPEILCDLLMDTSPENMWYGRARAMLLPVFQGLFELQTKINLVIDVETIQFAITLEGITFLYKHPFVSINVKLCLLAYLKCMPGVTYQDNTFIGDEKTRQHHVYLMYQIEPCLTLLQKGYDAGYFSSTPTDSIQEIIERNLVFYISTDIRTQAGRDLTFLMRLILKKLRYVYFKQFSSLVKTDDALSLIIMDGLIFLDTLIDWGDLLSASRALGYCCIFASCAYFYDQRINVNVANKILFNLDESQLNKESDGWLGSTIPELVKRYEHNSLISELRALKPGEFYCLNKDITKVTMPKLIKYQLPTIKKELSPLEPRYTLLKENTY